LDDGQLAISLGINAREHVKKKFDWNKSVEMMMKHYNEILTHT
jgi:glycosyltransferase involved in cell wall biosynthesis